MSKVFDLFILIIRDITSLKYLDYILFELKKKSNEDILQQEGGDDNDNDDDEGENDNIDQLICSGKICGNVNDLGNYCDYCICPDPPCAKDPEACLNECAPCNISHCNICVTGDPGEILGFE